MPTWYSQQRAVLVDQNAVPCRLGEGKELSLAKERNPTCNGETKPCAAEIRVLALCAGSKRHKSRLAEVSESRV